MGLRDRLRRLQGRVRNGYTAMALVVNTLYGNFWAIRYTGGSRKRKQKETAPPKRSRVLVHQMSAKPLPRYVAEFEGRHNSRSLDTDEQMRIMARGADGTAVAIRRPNRIGGN